MLHPNQPLSSWPQINVALTDHGPRAIVPASTSNVILGTEASGMAAPRLVASSASSPSTRIRVVFVIDNLGSPLGGSELNAVRTAEHLDRERFDLRLMTLKPDGPLRARYESIGVPISHVRVSSLHGSSMVSAGRRFVSYLRRERIQVVHAHDMYSNIFAVPWARMAGTPVVIASRRWWYTLPNTKLRIGNTLAFRMASAVLANSTQVAVSVRESDRVRHDRVWVIPNFLNDNAFQPMPGSQRQMLRTTLGIPADRFVIGCVARLVPVKDHQTLLRAFAAVHSAHPAAHLLIVGDGPARAMLETLARQLEINAAVTFAGERSDGVNYYHLCDAAALASLSEGFPNTVIEAMAAGCPVVATAVGGTIDAVTEGVTGALVPPGDVAEMARALTRLIEEPLQVARLGSAARERALSHYRAADVIASLENMYTALLAGART